MVFFLRPLRVLLSVPLRFFLADKVLTGLLALRRCRLALAFSFDRISSATLSAAVFASIFSLWLRNSFQQSYGFDVGGVWEHVDRLDFNDSIARLCEDFQVARQRLRVA